MEWEYQIQNFAIADKENALDQAQRDLNDLGSDGWEIFTIIPGTAIPGMNKNAQTWLYAFAKRPYPSLTTANEMATDADIDPKTLREALRDAAFSWHQPNQEWTVQRDSPQHKDMERVLFQLLEKRKKP